MDDIDYCHIGVPIDLDQLTLPIPSSDPDFIVESASDLFLFWTSSFLSFLNIARLFDWLVQWKSVLQNFLLYCMLFIIPSLFVFFFFIQINLQFM